MTYDITLLRVDPGSTVLRTLDRLNAEWESGIDRSTQRLDLSVADRAAWDAICGGVAELVGGFAAEELEFAMELVTESPALVLSYRGDEATIELPYRYDGTEAHDALRVAYEVARLVESEGGLTAIDPQTGRDCSAEHVEAAVDGYLGTRRRALSAMDDQPVGPQQAAGRARGWRRILGARDRR